MTMLSLDYRHNLQFDFLTPDVCQKLSDYLDSESGKFMSYELANAIEIPYERVNELIFALGFHGVLDVELLIYHVICSDAPIASRPIESGFPSLPYECESCGTEVIEPTELEYCLQAKTISKVRFI